VERGTAGLYADLDKFKQVNDQCGHAVGDVLIREVAARLRTATRPQDRCGRITGDEFAVLFRDTDRPAATEDAHRIVSAIEAPATIDGHALHIGASVRVATATVGEVAQLIHHADVAMYFENVWQCRCSGVRRHADMFSGRLARSALHDGAQRRT
jgi:diguanylate cyclase (GGDEF)-like protein